MGANHSTMTFDRRHWMLKVELSMPGQTTDVFTSTVLSLFFMCTSAQIRTVYIKLIWDLP